MSTIKSKVIKRLELDKAIIFTLMNKEKIINDRELSVC